MGTGTGVSTELALSDGYHGTDTMCDCGLCKEQEEQRQQLLEDEVAGNKMIAQLETDLLNRLISTYSCIINDADFKSGLSETKVCKVSIAVIQNKADNIQIIN